MTENEARQVLLLLSRESGSGHAHWSLDDRRWATRQAASTVGDQARPEHFVVARAAIAMQRLLPRDAAARRWLARRGWHVAWVVLAAVAGFGAGLLADQLGPPQRVNLLAPAVWIVVAWNLVVYLALLLPLPTPGFRAALARWGRGDDADAGTLWLQHAGPLLAHRAALILHVAAAALATGLVAGLYLRGLVLDYRAGWQSTFLAGTQVQWLLDRLLAPASALTGIPVPDVQPLRLGPAADAVATAAPWIHLYAATLAVFVIVPRLLLAAVAGVASAHRARHFRIPLDTPYFERLHPLMRPGLPRALVVLWVNQLQQPVRLLGQELQAGAEASTLLQSDEGDALQLRAAPAEVADPHLPATVDSSAPVSWWSRWRAPRTPSGQALHRILDQVEAVLITTTPQAARPAWLATCGRPVVVVVDGRDVEPPALSLQDLADGWLPDGRLLQALAEALPDDPRLPRLTAAWESRQQARLDESVTELAQTLARVATAHEPVPEAGLLPGRRQDPEMEAARAALVTALEQEMRAHAGRLAMLLGVPHAEPAAEGHAVPAAAAALHARVGEGRAALVGGVLSGALAGLKADLLSGGLTMGAGAVAGGLIGALATAGAARGLNVVRGAGRSYLAWNEEALAPVTEALLVRFLGLAYDLSPDDARERLVPALTAQQGALSTLWRARQRRYDNEGEAAQLAESLHAPLAQVIRQALAAPHPVQGVTAAAA